MFAALIEQIDTWIFQFTQLWPAGSLFSDTWNVKGLVATLLVCLVCGAMGSLVVGNRMAFFSDALAHCAFAGVGLGLLLFLVAGIDEALFRERLLYIMVVFGVGIGLLIAFVREQTGLASDTVIGVFFAGAIGFGAIFTRMFAENRALFNIENIIFGNPVQAQTPELILLALLTGLLAVVFLRMYNAFVLASVNPSLARSRRVPVRLCQYLLVVLLGLMINLSLQIVGTLLINGLLIVPAAAAANLARNLRQMFWLTIGLTLLSGLGGYLLSWELSCRYPTRPVGVSGTIVVLSVLLFAASAVLGAVVRQRRPAAA